MSATGHHPSGRRVSRTGWLRRTAAVAFVPIALLGPLEISVPAAALTTATDRPSAETTLPASPADPARPVTDPGLLAAIEAATGTVGGVVDRVPRIDADAPAAGGGPVVGVEVLTAHTAEVARFVGDVGGAVTGLVDGQVVQADVPVASVDDVALADGVSYVRAPQRVTRPSTVGVGTSRNDAGPGSGAVVGENVSLTNASAWQAAGFTGAVKIGIVDYFNLGLWSTSEEGPLPDTAHRFCLDTAADGEDICSPAHNSPTNKHDGYEHGVAVTQVLKDIAPGAEVYLATTATTSDLQAAVDWFVANGVRIVTRSLGAAFDGPGDGSGPLDSVVDDATRRGITWFNSAGNDAQYGYVRITVADDLSATDGYVDFDSGPGVDTLLRISGPCVLYDGVRWNDWNLPPDLRTDYSVELFAPTANPDGPGRTENDNPVSLVGLGISDLDQSAGAPPLEVADAFQCAGNSYGSDGGIMYMRIRRRPGTSVFGAADTMEIAIGDGYIEAGRWQAAYSAAKPVVDSRNPAVVAVGAVEASNGSGEPVGVYSSQGPTNDGRVKPDVTAPSCVASTIYAPACFSGTSASSPTAAGIAALLLDAGVALPGAPVAAAVKHFVLDRPFVAGGPADGPDSKYGTGQTTLPRPPPARIGAADAVPTAAAAFHQMTPTRIVDTRPSTQVGAIGGRQPVHSIVDVVITAAGVPPDATAVAVNLTASDTITDGYVQAVPYLRSTYGTSSTLNVPMEGFTKANFAIVPIGLDGTISVYLVPGGNLIVDVLGYFSPTASTVSAGRFVAIDPVRTLDTRTTDLVPAGWAAHVPAGESVVVPSTPAVPQGVGALVLNVTSTQAEIAGYLRAQPNGTAPTSSTVNYLAGVDASNTVIVPVGADGNVSIFTNAASHIVVDVTGYITGATAPAASTGLFVAVRTGRAFDSRQPPPGSPFAMASTRSLRLAGLAAPLPVVPPTATAVSINLTAVDQSSPGYLAASPTGARVPSTSSLNYLGNQAVANAALVKLGADGALDIYANTQAHVVVDVNGWFT